MASTLQFTVNGESRSVSTDPQRPLLDVLREDLHLTGTKYGCGEGQCRACTVLIDGRPVMSCITPALQAGGKKVTTIEGLARGDALHPLQEAFLVEGFQCGYCAAGMIMRAAAMLEKNPHPTDRQIIDEMNGNLCRCNNYVNALRAIKRASGQKLEEVSMS